jgi:hypothetical protein
MRSEQDEVEAGLGTRSHVWIAALSDKLPPCPSRAGASPAALAPAKCMYKRQTERVCPAERRHSLVIVWNGWFSLMIVSVWTFKEKRRHHTPPQVCDDRVRAMERTAE